MFSLQLFVLQFSFDERWWWWWGGYNDIDYGHEESNMFFFRTAQSVS